jgi:hypothetical protein
MNSALIFSAPQRLSGRKPWQSTGKSNNRCAARVSSCPMKRRLFHLFAGISLVLCAMILALLADNHLGHLRKVHWNLGRSTWFLFWSTHGEVGIECWYAKGPLVAGPNYKNSLAVAAWEKQFPIGSYVEKFGFRFGHEPSIGTTASGTLVEDGSHSYFVVPSWAMVALAVLFLLPGAAVMEVQRRSKSNDARKNGLCLSCGYDLRATPDRCPECGTVPKKILNSN